MKISALWITKNEEANIERSIASVCAVADEVVVVDTGSADGTARAARAAGARVETLDWPGDFAAARNTALGQVSGDVIVFLDADEWFEPALQKKDRAALEKLFENEKLLVGNLRRSNIDPENGAVINVDSTSRVLRGGGAVAYRGMIHEYLRETQGAFLSVDIPGWRLMHSGYSKENAPAKLRRNRELLKIAVQTGRDDAQKALYHYYLMREGERFGQYAEAMESLQWLMDRPPLMRRFLRDFPAVATSFFYEAVRLAARFCGQTASRAQVENTVVESAKTLYAHHPVSQTIECYYNLLCNYRQGVLLAELDAATEKAERLRRGGDINMEEYLRANIDLYTAAGNAAWLRGNRELAFDYASKAIRQTGAVLRQPAMALLLRCVKGLPAQDVLMFLNSMLQTGSRGILSALPGTLMQEGARDLYAYYVKKLLDAGWAKKSDFWYLMILLDKAEQAAVAAAQAQENAGGEVVQRTLFLAAACSPRQSLKLLDAYKGNFGRYNEVLQALYLGKRPGALDLQMAWDNYAPIAFAAGREAANRFLRLFDANAPQSALVQAAYYLQCGLYAEYLREAVYLPGAEDAKLRLLRAECLIHTKDFAAALREVTVLLANSPPGHAVFNLCAVVAENAPDKAVRGEAAQIMDKVRPLYQQQILWQDVANTGYAAGEESKKQRRALAQMDAPQFDKTVVPARFAALKGQVEAARGAGDAYLRQNRPVEAVGCLRCLLAYGAADNETFRALGRAFLALGNTSLAKAMEERVV